MAWTLGGQRIYTEKDTGWQTDPRLGEIDVLDSKETILHCAGRPSYRRTITFVVFSGYHINILPLADCLVWSGGLALVSDQGAEGLVQIKSFKSERLFDISRTTPVFRITCELIQKGSDGS